MYVRVCVTRNFSWYYYVYGRAYVWKVYMCVYVYVSSILFVLLIPFLHLLVDCNLYVGICLLFVNFVFH